MTRPKVLADTNIVSYMMRGGTLAQAYAPHLQGKLLSISFITVGELYYGAEKGQWGEQKRKALETTIRNHVVVPYDHNVARSYGIILAERQRQGIAISFADAWIAACAVRHQIPLVTHNARDFESIPGLEIITEYRPA